MNKSTFCQKLTKEIKLTKIVRNKYCKIETMLKLMIFFFLNSFFLQKKT